MACILAPLLLTTKPQRKPIVIVGAGPAALLFAHRTLQHDPEARVQLFERSSRAELGLDFGQHAGRSYGFALGGRGQAQLEAAGLLDPVAARGKRVTSIIKNNPAKLAISRNAMCLSMLEALEERYKSRVQCHHGLALEHVDLAARTLTLRSTGGVNDRHSVDGWELLVGADGVHSQVRAALARQSRGFRAKVHRSKRAWQALHLPATAGLPDDRSTFIDAGSLRSGAVVGFAVPQTAGDFAAVLSWPAGHAGARGPWGVRGDAAALRGELRAALPALREAPPEEELARFVAARPQHEHHVWCSRYHDTHAAVALLGDAAHGGYSMLGQGCSVALCGAACLQEQIARHEALPAALAAYTAAQRPEGVAVAELNLLSHIRFSRLGYFWQPLRKSVQHRLFSIVEDVSKPALSYADVARRYRPTIAASKVAWRFDRLRYVPR